MTNKKFQQELKVSIKEGIKPSDLKKLKKNNPQTATNIPVPPPFPNSEPNQQDLLAKIKKLEANNNLLTKTIQGLKDKPENKEINQGEILLFDCYHCQQNHNLSLLVLELPEGKLCQTCWKVLREKTKESLKEANHFFNCHNCQQRKGGTEYKVKLDASLKEYSICSTCLPLIKEYNEAESKSDRELDIWE